MNNISDAQNGFSSRRGFLRNTVMLAGVVVTVAQVALGGLREEFRSPQGETRVNTGPLFWMHGTESEKSAAVTVNGAYAGGFIGAPYRVDITRTVKPGANTLEAKPFRLVHPKVVVEE